MCLFIVFIMFYVVFIENLIQIILQFDGLVCLTKSVVLLIPEYILWLVLCMSFSIYANKSSRNIWLIGFGEAIVIDKTVNKRLIFFVCHLSIRIVSVKMVVWHFVFEVGQPFSYVCSFFEFVQTTDSTSTN